MIASRRARRVLFECTLLRLRGKCRDAVRVTVVAGLLAVAAILLLAVPASALISTGDGSWVWQRPLPQGNDFNDIAFADDLCGWAVGDAGTILRSHDGGATWSADRSGTDVDLLAIGVVDAQTAWAVGASGTILATSDGGATWMPQSSGAALDLHAVTAFSAQRVWVAGSGGTVLHSVNGGVTWLRQATACVADLHAVEFVTAADGWASGAGGALLHTTDGGLTWSSQDWAGTSGYPQDEVGRVDLRALSFVDEQTGWATGGWGLDWSDVVFVRTTDGGRSWTAMPDTMDFSLTSDIEFVDRDHGWVVTQDAQPDVFVRVAHTTDAGQTWSRTWSSMVFYDETPVSLAVGDDGQLWLAGPGGRMCRSPDGGVWNLTSAGVVDRLWDVTFADEATGWAAGDVYTWWQFPVLLATTDGGDSWTTTHIDDWIPEGGLNAVACFGADVVCVVGDRGSFPGMAWSRDGGATFTTGTPISNGINDVDLVSATRGWVVGPSAGISRSDDGGVTWQRQESPVTGVALQAVDFVDEDEGWVVGAAGTILRTGDGGATWRQQVSPTAVTLSDVAFGDRLNGWAVGGDGTVIHTFDGGAIWTPVATGVVADLSAVRTAGAVVRIAGATGTVATSRDGGSTWVVEWTGTHADFLGLTMVPSGRAWVVGPNGVILTTGAPVSDVTPPTTCDNAPAGWVNHDVVVTLSATDDESGVACTEYRLDDAPWTTGAQVVVAAPAGHGGDGVHEIVYRSVDGAGNVETQQSCMVCIDTREPRLVSPKKVRVSRRQSAITCIVFDPAPNAGWLVVRASEARKGNRPAWSVETVTGATGKVVVRLRDGLSRGSHRVVLRATDAAGNQQMRATIVKVIVRP